MVRWHFGKSGDSTSMFLSTLVTIIFHFLSYAALELTSWMLGYLISHSLWVALEGRHILFCTSCEVKPIFGVLRQVLWQRVPETGDRCLNFMKACLKLEYIQIWQRHLREMLLVCGSLLNGQRCFHHCCDLSKKQQQNTLHLNRPFASWAFPLSTVFLYVSRFYMLGEVLFCPLKSITPFAIKGNRPVLLFMDGILVSANVSPDI